jgi:hypothetical protein
MKCFLLSFALFVSIATAQAQQQVDSLKQVVQQQDSTLRASLGKVDSVKRAFNREASTLRNTYQKSLHQSDSLQHSLSTKIDSLRSFKRPTQKLEAKRDSIRQQQAKVAQGFTGRLDSLKRVTTAKLDSLAIPPELKNHLNKYTSKLNEVGLNTNVALPDVDIPGFSNAGLDLPSLKEIGNTDVLNLPMDVNMPQVDLPEPELGGIKDISGQAGDVASKAKVLSETNVQEAQTLASKEAEQQAANFGGAGELKKQTETFDKMMPAANGEEAKQQLMEQSKEMAVDHFAGKGDALKGAMEQVAKYKQKYTSVSSLEDVNLKHRPPNPLKEKPFVERLVPGISFQYQRRDDYLLDGYIYAGYKHTPRLVSGLGWNQRVARDKNNEYWNQRAVIFGPRAFAEYRVFRGFIAHAEGEAMNTFVPFTRVASNEGSRQWVWGMMTGLKTEYKITRWMKGTVLIQYNLFNRHHKAPYVDRLNSRLGFEFQVKKRKG